MKKVFIVANWKSNLTSLQANEWFQDLESGIKNQELRSQDKEIIVCTPFTLLATLKSLIINHRSSIKLGAQNISPFGEGAYTGEVNAKQVKEFADYVLIGHSERRKNFFEDNAMIGKKITMAMESGLTPILCVQDEKTEIPEGVRIVAYEPVFAIGSGNPDTPDNAEKMAQSIKNKTSVHYVLYGGSVDSLNVHAYTKSPSIDGILVGSASLDPSEFLSLIQHA